MTLFKFASLPLAVALLFWSDKVNATPLGAGGCAAGNLLQDSPAGAPHRTRPITTGSLADNGFTATIGETMLNASEPTTFGAGLPHPISLTAPEGKFFRGFLVRVSDPAGMLETTMTINPAPGDPDVQVALRCTDDEGVGGITHTNNTEKTEITGLIATEFGESNTTDTLTLDITMVVANRDQTSEFYYSQFTAVAFTPDTNNPPCPICGDDVDVLDPSKEIRIQSFPPFITSPVTLTCGALDNFALIGVVPENLCDNFQVLISQNCGCVGDEPVTFPPSMSPDDTPQPTAMPSVANILEFRPAIAVVAAAGVALFM